MLQVSWPLLPEPSGSGTRTSPEFLPARPMNAGHLPEPQRGTTVAHEVTAVSASSIAETTFCMSSDEMIRGGDSKTMWPEILIMTPFS